MLKVPWLRLDMAIITAWRMYGICRLRWSLTALSLLSTNCDSLALSVGALVDVYQGAACGSSEAWTHLRRLLQQCLLAFRASSKIILGFGRIIWSICCGNASLNVLMVDIWSGALCAVNLRGLASLFALEGVSSIRVHNSRGKVPILHRHLMLKTQVARLLLLQILWYLGLLPGVVQLLRIKLFLKRVVSTLSLGFWNNLQLLTSWLLKAVIRSIFDALKIHCTIFYIWLAVRADSSFTHSIANIGIPLVDGYVLLDTLLWHLLPVWHLLNIVDINVVNSIIEITHIKCQRVLINKFHIVYLLINILKVATSLHWSLFARAVYWTSRPRWLTLWEAIFNSVWLSWLNDPIRGVWRYFPILFFKLIHLTN